MWWWVAGGPMCTFASKMLCGRASIEKAILKKLEASHSGMRASEVAEGCGLSYSGVYVHLERLRRANKVIWLGRRWYPRRESDE